LLFHLDSSHSVLENVSVSKEVKIQTPTLFSFDFGWRNINCAYVTNWQFSPIRSARISILCFWCCIYYRFVLHFLMVWWILE